VSSPRVSRSVRVANPLSAILAFLGFCEVTTGVAATVTAEGIQVAFTAFSLGFPLVVLAGLGVFLWKKPEVLYAPGDFSKETPIQTYVDAVRGQNVQSTIEAQTAALREIVESAVESTIVQYQPAAGTTDDASAIARSVAEEEISKHTIVVDVPTFALRVETMPFPVPVAGSTTVDQFLNTVFYAMDGVVRPYTYGTDWVLLDPAGRELHDIGTDYAVKALHRRRDERTLAEAGIAAGSRLAVRLFKEPIQFRL
jgi:hypothetical protein